MRFKPRSTPSSAPDSPEMEQRPRPTQRRGFLLALGAGGLGAAAIAARSLTGNAPAAAAADAADSAGDGYRVTDHVKRYYQTTKI